MSAYTCPCEGLYYYGNKRKMRSWRAQNKRKWRKKKKTRQKNKTYYLFRYVLQNYTLYINMSISALNSKNPWIFVNWCPCFDQQIFDVQGYF